MLVTLMDGWNTKTLSLPDKPAGRYWIEGYDERGSKRNIMMFEPREGCWAARCTQYAKPGGDVARHLLRIEPSQYVSYPFAVFDKNGGEARATLLIEPNTDDRIEYRKYLPHGDVELVIGRKQGCDILFNRGFVSSRHAAIAYREGRWSVQDLGSSNGTYLNDVFVEPGSRKALKPGDVVFVVGLRIVIGATFIALNNPDGMVTLGTDKLRRYVVQSAEPLVEPEDWEKGPSEDEGFFFRSPRFRREIQTREIVIDAPPEVADEGDMSLMQTIGPALIMGVAALFSGIVMAFNTLENGGSWLMAAPMLVMSISMILGMALFPVIARRSQRKKSREDEKTRQEKYLRYLADVRNEIVQEAAFQKQVLQETFLAPEVYMKRALQCDRALWERTVDHDDFLELRVGLGTRALDAEIVFPERHFSLKDDNLLDAMYDLAEAPTDLQDVPVTISLVENRVSGIIGPRDAVCGLVRNLLVQVTALHSYDELKLVFIVDEEERQTWSYTRLFPHTWNDDRTERYFACGLQEAQELSLVLEKEAARREEQRAESGAQSDEALAVPQYLVIAASKRVADRCGFVSSLLDGATDLGFSLVTLYDVLENVPKEGSVVVSLEGGGARIFDKNDTAGRDFTFTPDEPVSRFNVVATAIAMANTFMELSDQRFELPSVLTFMQMLKAGRVEHLDVLTRWKENDPTVSLIAPVGVDANGDLFNLDLHEKNHGPHGLVAGMTGSGKSEFIITLVLSLALNYSPDEIAFVLIDYKGGGLANAFDNERIRLPHLAGTITNLDGASISRSLVSIEAELKRRQVMFNNARARTNEGTMDIYKYQQLFRQGLVDEPLPHLFVISDEFAELKMQQPEFMDQLVSTARIGRSLGVHLILATQKPSGVVNDQIWSNAKFKICLKVQDRADSMDMIRRPEAAELVETGRFYLQVGFNEFFALGQSAWAGAPYVATDHVREERDDSIAVIDDLGHVLREARPPRTTQSDSGKQLVKVIDYICESAESVGKSTRPLWLDPIPAVIYVDDLREKYGWRAPGIGGISAVVGEYDDPARQEQGILAVDFPAGGNLVVYGASGSGKSMFVTSLVYSLITSYSPDELHVYLLDFGAESLKAFDRAPHVGDVVLVNDDEKVASLLRMLEGEIVSRRKLFADYGGDFAAYTRSASEGVPAVVVAIEGLAALLEIHEEAREKLLSLTRDSAKYGIFFTVTAETTAVVGFRMAQNFGQALALRMNDDSEYSSVMGSGRVRLLSGAYGAGVVKRHEILQFQTAHALAGQASTTEAVRAYCDGAFSDYSGPLAPGIPTLPEVVTPEVLSGMPAEGRSIPLGIDAEALVPVGLDPFTQSLTIASSDDEDGLASFARGLCGYLYASGRFNVAVLDPESVLGQLGFGVLEAIEHHGSAQEAAAVLLAYARGERPVPELCVVIDLHSIMGTYDFDAKGDVEQFFENAGKGESAFFVIGRNQDLSEFRYDPWLNGHLSGTGVWIGNGLTDQGLVKPAAFSSELMRPLDEGFGYVLVRGKPRLCKVLQHVSEDDLAS